jgi:hypothetical protein
MEATSREERMGAQQTDIPLVVSARRNTHEPPPHACDAYAPEA